MADEAYYKDGDIIGKARKGIMQQLDILQDMVREYRSREIQVTQYHIENMTDMGLRKEEFINMAIMRVNLHDIMTIAANAQRVLQNIENDAFVGKALIDVIKYV